LKSEYTGKNDKTEQKLEGYIIDIVKKTGLVEIQTKNFLKIKPKLKKLLGNNNIKLVHNIASIKWLIKTDENGNAVSKRKSSKKGLLFHIFDELIYITDIISNPNFSLDIVMTEEEEVRQDDGKGSWRRKGVSIKDRKLVKIIEKIKFNNKNDYFKILPANIAQPFSTKDIAAELKISIYLARKILYCYKKIKLINCIGKKGNLLLYKKSV
jgi:hypothetical protein